MTRDLFKDIDSEVVQRTLHNIQNNLKEIVDKQFYHIKRHMNKDDIYLQRRIIYKGINTATSFYQMDTAEFKAICLKTLNNNWQEISNFLVSSANQCLVYSDYKNDSLGFGYIVNQQGVFENLHKVCVCIAKRDDLPYGLFIQSMYLIITDDIIPDTSVEWNCYKKVEKRSLNAI